MIGRHGTARQRQFRQPGLGRDEHFLGAEPRPDGIERLQPAKQQRILPARNGAGQGLIQVVMGIHQTGRHNTAARLDHPADGCQSDPHGSNHPAADQHISPGDLAPCAVHRHDAVRTPNKDFGHPLLLCPAPVTRRSAPAALRRESLRLQRPAPARRHAQARPANPSRCRLRPE